MHDELDPKLRRTLRRPEPPAGLRSQLHANLQVQARAETPTRLFRGTVAALVVVWAIFAGSRFPESGQDIAALIAAARQHVHDEAGVRVVDLTGLQTWLQAVDARPPAPASVEMFKNCVVDGVSVKHLRLRLSGGAVADLMVDTSGHWRSLTGARNARGWLVAQPRPHVSLVAVFTPNRGMEVAAAVAALFPGSNTPFDPHKEV